MPLFQLQAPTKRSYRHIQDRSKQQQKQFWLYEATFDGFYTKWPCLLYRVPVLMEFVPSTSSQNSDNPYDNDFWDFVDNDDDEVDRTEQIFNFVDAPPFLSLFSGSPNEPLYFVKVTKKELLVKTIQLYMAISYLLLKTF